MQGRRDGCEDAGATRVVDGDAITPGEIDAGRRLLALAAVVAADGAAADDAARHALRLRFALERIDDARRQARVAASAVAGERLVVALAVLERHVAGAGRLIDGVVGRPPPGDAARVRSPGARALPDEGEAARPGVRAA